MSFWNMCGVMWVCEASEVILKGLQWKSWSDDGQDGPSENYHKIGSLRPLDTSERRDRKKKKRHSAVFRIIFARF